MHTNKDDQGGPSSVKIDDDDESDMLLLWRNLVLDLLLSASKELFFYKASLDQVQSVYAKGFAQQSPSGRFKRNQGFHCF
jgi:hypothetical protein